MNLSQFPGWFIHCLFVVMSSDTSPHTHTHACAHRCTQLFLLMHTYISFRLLTRPVFSKVEIVIKNLGYVIVT